MVGLYEQNRRIVNVLIDGSLRKAQLKNWLCLGLHGTKVFQTYEKKARLRFLVYLESKMQTATKA